MKSVLPGLLLVALLPFCSALAAGDARRGEEIYSRCVACHALAYDRTGPHHCGVVGRRAGSVPGFAYSPAMKRSGIVWTEQTLDRFLADPMKTVPGTAIFVRPTSLFDSFRFATSIGP